MVANITPVNLFKFGPADACRVQLNSDDLATNATFFFQLGKWFQPAVIPAVVDEEKNVVTPAVTPEKQFIAADNVIGNASIQGEDYKQWDGSTQQALALIQDQVGVTFVK